MIYDPMVDPRPKPKKNKTKENKDLGPHGW